MNPRQSPFHKVTLGQEDGRATQLVWLHGWGQTHASLLPLARMMAPGGSNILYDLPGFGATERLADGADTADYAAALAAELSALAPGQRLVIGHSFGCRVALRLAATRPELVDALFLIAPAGLPRRRSTGWRLKAAGLKVVGRTARYMDRIFNSGFHDRFGERFGSADYRNAGPLRKTLIKVVNEDLSQVARQVNVPVQIVVGEADGEAPPEISRRYESLIAAAGLVVLPGYGHLDILSHGRHQVEARIVQFLKEQGLGE